MRRIDWIWVFFVIIAVGLVLSWGRTGQRLVQDRPPAADRVDTEQLLATESPCRPLFSPCAAIGDDLAIVLGPVRGQADLVAVELVADTPDRLDTAPEVDWQPVDDDTAPALRLAPRALSPSRWVVALPQSAAPAPRLSVRLNRSGQEYAARFPLH